MLKTWNKITNSHHTLMKKENVTTGLGIFK